MSTSVHQIPYCRVVEWLKSHRHAQGISMRVLAATLGVPHTWIAKVESGERRMDVLEFVQLCHALGVKPSAGLRVLLDAIRQDDGQECASGRQRSRGHP